jgi:predicted phosphodiesterase
VVSPLTRILSDIHFADKSSRVAQLEQLRPLFDGADALLLNGDTLDTRPSPDEPHTAAVRAAVLAFFGAAGRPVTFLTGNHDPNVSPHHSADLAGGRVWVTHGDVLFDNIVPWSSEAPILRTRVIAALARLPEGTAPTLEERLAVFRQVAASIPQRHQVEKNLWKYLATLAGDTVWPPPRVFTILRAWREAPLRAAALARRHRPQARYVLIGHTHRPGITRTADGIVVVNTGAFCRPFGSLAVDVTAARLRVRPIEFRRGSFHLGGTRADYPLA